MATPDAPVQVPSLRSYTQPFTGVDSVAIVATDHGLGPVTLQNLIVQVYELPEIGDMSQLLPPSAYEYLIDSTTHDVLVGLRQPTTGSVLLTVLGPPVPLDVTTLTTMPPTPPVEAPPTPPETPPVSQEEPSV